MEAKRRGVNQSIEEFLLSWNSSTTAKHSSKLNATEYWLHVKGTRFVRLLWRLKQLYLSNSFRMAARACLGTLIGILFVFVPTLYNAFPDAPLALIYYIINLTFFVQELHFGIVMQASCLTAIALIFGACFGAVAALAARASIGITIVLAAIGTGLFTILHSDTRVSGMVYYTGESNFVFNLLDTRTLGNSSILYTMRITLVASALSIVFSLVPAILIFPKFSAQDMKLSIRDALNKLGSSMSSISCVLFSPYLAITIIDSNDSLRGSMERLGGSIHSGSKFKNSSSNSSDSSLDDDDDTFQETLSNSDVPTRQIAVDPGTSSWLKGSSYNLHVLESILEGDTLISAQGNIKRARTLANYSIFEPNLFQFMRKEPIRLWLRVIDAVEDLISRVDAIRSVLEGGRRRYKADTLQRWKGLIPVMKELYARMATTCSVLGSCVSESSDNRHMYAMRHIKDEILQMEEMERKLKSAVRSSYISYWDSTRTLRAESTALELGPLMFVLVMSKSLLESLCNINEEFFNLMIARKKKSFRRGYHNLFGWTRSLFWSFEVWYHTIGNIPRNKTELYVLLGATEFHYFVKKWIGELLIIIIFLVTPLYKYVENFDGLWLWMAYMIYMTPTVEGTLIGGLVTIIGCGSGVLMGFLLMNWKQSAMEPYGLGAVIVFVTTVAVYFMNGPFYSSLLTTCTTLYVMILYQYSPYEYKATWHYPLARFVNISLGVIIAVFLSEFILPHSALKEARQCLALAVRKMSRWHRWLLSEYFELMGRHGDRELVYGTIKVEPIDSRTNGKPDSNMAKIWGVQNSPDVEMNGIMDQRQQSLNEHTENQTLGSTAKESLKPVNWKQEIQNDFNKALYWLGSVQNGVSAKLHAIPQVITIAVEYERKIIPRLSAFSTLLDYEPFVTGHLAHTHYDLFIKPLIEDLLVLQESRKNFVQVITSCIMEGKPFNSIAFVREFGYVSARETTKAAWIVAGYMRNTGTALFNSLNFTRDYFGAWKHFHSQPFSKGKLNPETTTMDQIPKAQDLTQSIFEVEHLSNQLREQGLMPITKDSMQQPLTTITEEADIPSKAANELSIELPSRDGSHLDSEERGTLMSSSSCPNFENVAAANNNDEEKLGSKIVELADTFDTIEQKPSKKESQIPDTSNSNPVPVDDEVQVELPSASVASLGLTRSYSRKTNRDTSLNSSNIQQNKRRSNILWKTISKLNTSSAHFGDFSHGLLEAVFHASNESKKAVPPIVENLMEGSKQVRLAQARFYARYLQLEHAEYERIFDDPASLVNHSGPATSEDQSDETSFTLYDAPYIRSADDHILFLSAFFVSSYVFDGFKNLGLVLADAVLDDLQDLYERHHILVKKGVRRLEKRLKRQRRVYQRRKSHRQAKN
ncbi:hypothetical protein GpartN1_g2027.t1 [Galdieria partita]|uniref:Integral membrane bound transporter domain-containing protein n=1 Tax=Galdieria partita TaxID=83374 RepID=A0A9C7PTM3_9RHOD|nr:hypothetical protein GpartN1_g2027.t1 [Galdieria partita]